MLEQGVKSSSFRSGQLVSSGQLLLVDYARPLTSEGHISFVRTPTFMFLESMESPLIQEYINMPEWDIIFQNEVLDQDFPGQVNSSVQVSSSGLTTRDQQLRKVISPSFELRFGCSWTQWKSH